MRSVSLRCRRSLHDHAVQVLESNSCRRIRWCNPGESGRIFIYSVFRSVLGLRCILQTFRKVSELFNCTIKIICLAFVDFYMEQFFFLLSGRHNRHFFTRSLCCFYADYNLAQSLFRCFCMSLALCHVQSLSLISAGIMLPEF